ncbi:predicted protein [Neisseria gonorrhoeae PID1]|nr:predicted protein [Neisseria gonorrhoeae PID18]EEZ51552.1 predicted protein [Neisseria gonorrhoeae PID1]EEZ58455.1 predicted protein [Neisseria gonorrhoeae SK-93-1035]
MPMSANRQIAGRMRKFARASFRMPYKYTAFTDTHVFYANITNQNQTFKTLLMRLFRTKGRRASGKKGFCI